MKAIQLTRRTALASVPFIVAPLMARATPVTTLNWFMWSGSDAEVAAWKHLCDMVHAKHPDIVVNFMTASWSNYWTKLPALAASGQLPDIISLQSMRAPGFASLMEPLGPYMQNTGFDIGAFDPTIIRGLSVGGDLHALPYDYGPWITYYNADMFQKAGLQLPGAGWRNDDFVKQAKLLTKGSVYGCAVSVPDAFLSYAASDGASYLNQQGQLDLTNPALEAAFTSYAALVGKDHVAPLFPSSSMASAQQANGDFTAGNVGMYVDGPWDLINVAASAKFKVGLAPLPAGKAGSVSLVAGSGFGISRSSHYKQAAWKAIQVLTSPEAEAYLASQGRAFPARIAQQADWYNVTSTNVVGAKAAIDAALQAAKPYDTTANWSTVDTLFEQYAPLAFGGEHKPAQVLKTIQQLAAE